MRLMAIFWSLKTENESSMAVVCCYGCILYSIRPAISPDLGRRLPAFSLLNRLSGFHVKISGEIIKFLAFVFFRTTF